MLLPDHIAAGILISHLPSNKNRYLFLFLCISASIIADIPILFNAPGSIGYLAHRKYTTTFILAPLYAIIPVLIIYIIQRIQTKDIIRMYAASLFAYIIHIFLDLLTPFGTQIFYPLSNEIYSFDYFFALDPIFLTISFLIITSLIIRFMKNKGFLSKSTIYIYVSCYIVYFVINGFIKTEAGNNFNKHVTDNNNAAIYIKTIPRIFYNWKGIAKEPGNYLEITDHNNKLKIEKYKLINDIPASIIEDSDFKAFMDYARYPVFVKKTNSFEIINLIYSPDTYRLTYILNTSGQVTSRSLTSFNLLDKKL